MFEVEPDGHPKPEVKWYKNGVPIVPGAKYRVKDDGDKVQLIVKDVNEGDAGEITCELVSPKGREEATCKLNVQSMYGYSTP